MNGLSRMIVAGAVAMAAAAPLAVVSSAHAKPAPCVVVNPVNSWCNTGWSLTTTKVQYRVVAVPGAFWRVLVTEKTYGEVTRPLRGSDQPYPFNKTTGTVSDSNCGKHAYGEPENPIVQCVYTLEISGGEAGYLRPAN